MHQSEGGELGYRCSHCGFEEKRNFCPNCGAPLSGISDTTDKSTELKGPWTERCPVCRSNPLRPVIEKKVLGGEKVTDIFKCSSCDALFVPDGGKYKLARVRDKLTQVWKEYGNKSLTTQEWRRIAYGGMSDARQRKAIIMDMLADITEEKNEP